MENQSTLTVLEIFLFMLAGQAVHVLTKLRDAQKQFKSDFKAITYFRENQLTLSINGLLIVILGFMFIRSGIDAAVSNMAASKEWWFPFMKYALLLTVGYAIQSFFNFLLKGVLRKTGIETVGDEKETGAG